ncbi:class I SAM-dependent methyltransferase, partial [Aromatoleum toluclasticum]|uniref:class I SAM-dependent methyltransferase n=1 Tax=Aromatoleum toluclasticum TaxID=92003 RepID=UPI001D194274
REGWPDSVGTRFINRYVFPDGELDTVSNVQRAMERVGFEIWDVEGLRPHYALTLRHWGERLEARRSSDLKSTRVAERCDLSDVSRRIEDAEVSLIE